MKKLGRPVATLRQTADNAAAAGAVAEAVAAREAEDEGAEMERRALNEDS